MASSPYWGVDSLISWTRQFRFALLAMNPNQMHSMSYSCGRQNDMQHTESFCLSLIEDHINQAQSDAVSLMLFASYIVALGQVAGMTYS